MVLLIMLCFKICLLTFYFGIYNLLFACNANTIAYVKNEKCNRTLCLINFTYLGNYTGQLISDYKYESSFSINYNFINPKIYCSKQTGSIGIAIIFLILWIVYLIPIINYLYFLPSPSFRALSFTKISNIYINAKSYKNIAIGSSKSTLVIIENP
jgi:hypothetical protein